MLMAISTMETGRTIWPTERDSTSIVGEHDTRVSGKAIFSMGLESRPGRMGPNMKDSMITGRSTAMAHSHLLTVAIIKAILSIMKSLGTVSTTGRTASSIKAPGRIAK
jgi:hypothetical protein